MVPTVMTGRLIDERLKNIGELKRREIELERLSRRLELALDTSQIGVWELNIETDELFWDDRINELYGYPADGGHARLRALGARAASRRPRPRALEDFRAGRRDQRQLPDRNTACCSPAARCATSARAARPTRMPASRRRIVGVNWDVTADVTLNENLKRANMLTEARNVELEAAKARIEFNALHDSLTGLPNRRYLDEVLAAHIERFETEGERAGPAAYRPRPLQADQRHARPCRRRRHADACGAAC